MTMHGLHGAPDSAGFAYRTTPGGANLGDFLQNPCGQLLDRVEILKMIAQSVDGERGEPESDLGSLLRELIHLGVP